MRKHVFRTYRNFKPRRCVNAQLMKSSGKDNDGGAYIDAAISHILWRLFELFNAHVGQVDNAMGEALFVSGHIVRQIVGLCKRRGLFIFLAFDKRRFPARSDNSHDAKNFKRQFHPVQK